MRIRSLLSVAATAVTLAGCSGSIAEATAPGACPADAVCVAGTVRYYTFEGGFWAVRGDDGTTYTPRASLPAEFRTDGLRVRLVARPRPDLGSFYQAGPIVDVLALSRL